MKKILFLPIILVFLACGNSYDQNLNLIKDQVVKTLEDEAFDNNADLTIYECIPIKYYKQDNGGYLSDVYIKMRYTENGKTESIRDTLKIAFDKDFNIILN